MIPMTETGEKMAEAMVPLSQEVDMIKATGICLGSAKWSSRISVLFLSVTKQNTEQNNDKKGNYWENAKSC